MRSVLKPAEEARARQIWRGILKRSGRSLHILRVNYERKPTRVKKTCNCCFECLNQDKFVILRRTWILRTWLDQNWGHKWHHVKPTDLSIFVLLEFEYLANLVNRSFLSFCCTVDLWLYIDLYLESLSKRHVFLLICPVLSWILETSAEALVSLRGKIYKF